MLLELFLAASLAGVAARPNAQTCRRDDAPMVPLLNATAAAIRRLRAPIVLNPTVLFGCGKPTIEQLLRKLCAAAPGRTLVYVVDDFELKLQDNRCLVARTSMRRSLAKPSEAVLPYMWEALAPNPPLPAGPRPIVGFRGVSAGRPARQKLLDALSKDPRVDSRFEVQTRFNNRQGNSLELFKKNMRDAHFNVGTRGRGNFAIRFWQTLSAGRIPVTVDSNQLLPLAGRIDWAGCAVIKNTITEVVEEIVRIHASGDVEARQRRCRAIHEAYFAGVGRAGYAAALVEDFSKLAAESRGRGTVSPGRAGAVSPGRAGAPRGGVLKIHGLPRRGQRLAGLRAP